MTLKKAAVILLLRDEPPEVLLGYKKTGFGKGKLSVIGGKIKSGETSEDTVIRELHEETGIHITPAALCHTGQAKFIFPACPDWDLTFQIYTSHQWDGIPAESEEVSPCWFSIAQLPYETMWPDAAIWIPPVLQNKTIDAHFVYADDNETLRSSRVCLLNKNTATKAVLNNI